MSQLKRVLLTGGCGYIGSHTLVELLGTTRYEVHILDNLSNSSVEPLRRVETIVNAPGTVVQNFHQMDLCDEAKVDELFARIHFDAVIHFAGLKAVGESVSMPLWYYQNNLVSTLVLLKAMKNHGCNAIIFSSSATVYGLPRSVPITEDFVIQPTNPYGQTKGMIEQILQDAAVADAQLRVVILRYFNPVGAHKSGTIGESPKQPNNLLPYVAQVAVGRRPFLSVMGNGMLFLTHH
jgi:UDP-glucose 4-epimerase